MRIYALPALLVFAWVFLACASKSDKEEDVDISEGRDTLYGSPETMGACVTDDDCLGEEDYCCGTNPIYRCQFGVCTFWSMVAYDDDCCMEEYGCGPAPLCRPGSFADAYYNGTCSDRDCASLYRNVPENWTGYYGCCTRSSSPDHSEPVCGVERALFEDSTRHECLALGELGRLDSDCPDGELNTDARVPLRGCCSPAGYCGVMFNDPEMLCALPVDVTYALRLPCNYDELSDAGADEF